MAEDTISSSTIADTLLQSVEARREEVSNRKEKTGLRSLFSIGDSTKTILSSIEKSMYVQTDFLGKISDTLSQQLEIQRDSNFIAAEDREDRLRSERLESVSEDPPPPEEDDQSLLDKIKEKAGGAGRSARDKLIGAEDDSLLKKIGKTLTTGIIGGLLVSGFVGQAAKDGFKRLGFSDEKSEAMGESVGDASGFGFFTGLIASTVKFFTGKGPGLLRGALVGAVTSLTYDAVKGLDIDKDGKILGMKTELVAGVAAGLAGIVSFTGVGKAIGALGKVLKKSYGFVRNKLTGAKVTKAPDLDKMVNKNAVKPTNASKGGLSKLFSNAAKVATGGATAVSQGMPSAINLGPQGTPVTQINRNSTIDAVGDAVKASKPERYAKFAKFFKFAGPVAGVVPALIDPALAIYNDEPDEVVRKEIAGALGSIGGATLGAIAGSSVGGSIGLLGAGIGAIPGGIIGGFVGGIGGAFAGEWLAEKITDALMGGPEVDPKDMNKLIDEKKDKDKSSGITPTAKISSADTGPTDEQRVADAQVKADATGKALADFESTAKSRRTVTEMDDFGFETTKTVFDDAKEQEQFDKLNAANFDAENELFDAKNKLITGDEFETAGQFEKLVFLQEKGILPEGEHELVMGKFVGGPLKGMTTDEAIAMHVTQQSQIAKSASEFKAGDKSVPTIEADPTKPVTEDGKIPARVAPTTVKSAELQAAEDKESQTQQAMKDFETENADIMTREDLGGGFYSIKFSDPEKQKEYDALEDQAILDREAVERQEVRDAVDSGEFTNHYGRQMELEDFRENEAASLSALKELKAAEKEEEAFLTQMGVESYRDIQDPIMKAKAEELKDKVVEAKSEYRKTNRAQLGMNQENNRQRYSDQRQTLMTEYNMTDAEMDKLGISENKSRFGPTTQQRMSLDAFKRQKDEEKLEILSRGITGVESMPDKLIARVDRVDQDAKEQDVLSRGAKVMQTNNNIDSSTKVDNRRGGNKTDIYITKGDGGRSLRGRGFRPVPQSGD